MSHVTAILSEHAYEEAHLWHLSGGDSFAETWWQGSDLQELLRAWPEIHRNHRASFQQLVVLPRSATFMFGIFPRADVAGSTKRATLQFRLEADLPLSAEELACDFQFGATSIDDAQVSTVSCQHADWSPLLQQLRRSSCRLELLTPKSLVLLQAVVERQSLVGQPRLILLHIDGQFEIVALSNNQVVQWRIPGSLSNASRDWQVLRDEFPGAEPLVVLTSEQAISREEAQQFVASAEVPVPEPVKLLVIDEQEMTKQQIARVLAERSTVWFDLSQDEHFADSGASGWWAARHHRALLIVSGCLLLVALACGWRASRVRSAVASLQEQQATLVRSALPEQRISSAVLARLKSEHTKLLGSRGRSENAQLPTTVLPVLRQVIENLPLEVPVSVHELRLDGTEIYLDVEVAQFQEAGALAQALQASGLSMSPPSTATVKEGKIRAQMRGTPVDATSGGRL